MNKSKVTIYIFLAIVLTIFMGGTYSIASKAAESKAIISYDSVRETSDGKLSVKVHITDHESQSKFIDCSIAYVSPVAGVKVYQTSSPLISSDGKQITVLVGYGVPTLSGSYDDRAEMLVWNY